MDKSFEMLSPFSHSFAGAATGDFALPGSFTALLISDDDHDVLVDDFPDQKPLFLPPLPETLESLIPPSVLSGEELNPRKRALVDVPRQVRIPMLDSPDEFPMARLMLTQKVPRVEVHPPISTPAPPPTLDSILNGFSLSEFVAALIASPENDKGAPVRSPTADKGKKKHLMEVAKTRRQRISEKVRCLGNLLPGEHRKTIATMLEEAYDYIKFLQAQIQALSSMPARSGGGVARASHLSGVSGVLGSLSRQQLLQVVVNTPAAQAVLSSEKCCVVSAEQVALLRKILQQHLSAAGL